MAKEISLMKDRELNNFYKELNPIIQSIYGRKKY